VSSYLSDPLGQRMRYAAEVLEAVNKRIGIASPDWHWRPSELRSEAEHVEAEDREAAEREEMVRQMARDLFTASYDDSPVAAPFYDTTLQRVYGGRARKLIEAGWRKGDPE
jgi:hypothetical protein